MKKIFALLFCFYSIVVYAQKQGNVWVLGYQDNFVPNINEYLLDFRTGTLNLISRTIAANVGTDANTSICDTDGNLQFFTNGYHVFDKNSNRLTITLLNPNVNGSRLGHSTTYGYYMHQATLLIPKPNDASIYWLLTQTLTPTFFPFRDISTYIAGDSLRLWKIDGRTNQIVGTSQYLLKDTLDREGLDVCRHANGRDWWLFAPENASNRFYRFLIDPQGVRYHGEQRIGDSSHYRYQLGQSCFSPDGTWWVRRRGNVYGNTVGYELLLYRFDRCSGQLSNPVHLQYPTDTSFGGGIAISPNSRYLYVTTNEKLFQYDLQAANIGASRQVVGSWDGFANPRGWQTRFFHARLALDNKIYISTTPATQYLHIIHAPDSAGVACRLQQRAVELFTYNRTLPFLPNYRTGRLVGSPCDTVRTASEDLDTGGGAFKLYPNPAKDHVTFSWQSPLNPPEGGRLFVFDVSGKVVLQQSFSSIWGADVDVSSLPNGIYLYKLQVDNRVPHTGKLMIINNK